MVKSIVLNYAESSLVIFDNMQEASCLNEGGIVYAEPLKEMTDLLWCMTLLKQDYHIEVKVTPRDPLMEKKEHLFEILDRFYKRNKKIISLLRFIADKRIFPEAAAMEQLSPMQKKILSLIRKGLTYTAIADRLCISPHTVNGHRKNAMRVLGVSNIKELLAYLDRFEMD